MVDRRAYFRGLARQAPKGACVAPESLCHVVSFDLPGVLRFQAAGLRSYVQPRPVAKKRPNYNNSRRRFYAKEHRKHQHLDFF